MPVPAEILAVKRPKNTRVKAGPKGIYYVIARTCVYKNGRNVPKELGIVGRIIDGKYVPNPDSKDEGIDIKKYGTAALFHKVGSSIYELHFFENTSKNGLKYRKNKCKACEHCPKKQFCTTSVSGRNIQRWEYESVLEQVGAKTAKHNEIYKQRRSIIEHPFGTIKRQLF